MYENDALDRLAKAIAVEQVKDRLKIGDNAYEVLTAQIGVLGGLKPAELGVGSDRTTDDVPEAVAVGMRTAARHIAAIFFPGRPLAEVAHGMHGLVANPDLTPRHWERVLAGRDGDPSLDVLARCAAQLRAGVGITAASEHSGASLRQARGLNNLLGVDEWWDQKLLDEACLAVEQGVSVRHFQADWNAGRPDYQRISRGTAHNMLVEARRVLAPVTVEVVA